jgi:hypothetical protein
VIKEFLQIKAFNGAELMPVMLWAGIALIILNNHHQVQAINLAQVQAWNPVQVQSQVQVIHQNQIVLVARAVFAMGNAIPDTKVKIVQTAGNAQIN